MSCQGCNREWTGYTECHCGENTGCHRHFGSVYAFDAHLGSNGSHNDPPLKTKKGKPAYKLILRASGPVWVGARESNNPQWIASPGTAPDLETAS